MKRAVVLTVLGFASCTGAETTLDLPFDTPSTWSTSAARGPVESAWWRAYGGEELAELVEATLANNLDLRVAAARVRQAEAQAQIAGADLFPQVGAGIQSERAKRNYVGLPLPGATGPVLSSTSNTIGVSLDLSWEADLWGRMSAAQKAAYAGYAESTADLAAAELSLTGQVLKTWFALAEARRQLEFTRAIVANLERSVSVGRTRYERGSLDAASLHDLERGAAEARSAIALHERQVDLLLRQLEQLAGRYPSAEWLVDATLPEELAPVPAGMPAEILARRPDLVAAEARLRQADARLHEAKASLWPRFSITTSSGASSNELEDLLHGDFQVWSFVANLAGPIFQGGRLRAGVSAAEAGVDQAQHAFASEALRAFAEVEAGLQAEQLLKDRVGELDLALGSARGAVDATRTRFERGTGSGLALLERERSVLQARSARSSAHHERLEARIDLHLALGGGFSVSADAIPFE